MDEATSQTAADALKHDLTRHFSDLTTRGLQPNAAAAISAKIIYGKVKPAVDVQSLLRAAAEAQQSQQWQAVLSIVHHMFSSPETLALTFLSPATSPSHQQPDLNRLLIEQVYRSLSDLQSELLSEMCMLVQHSVADWQALGGNSDAPDEHYQLMVLCAMSVMLLNPWLDDDQTGRRFLNKAMHFTSLWPPLLQKGLMREMVQWSSDQVSRLVIAIEQHLTISYFEDEMKIGSTIREAVKFLSIVSKANDRSNAISYTAFYLDIINGESFDVKRDYVNWKRPGLLSDSDFSFCQYPFVYEPSTKTDILAFENTGEMREQFQDAVFESMFSGGSCPYLLLRVRRSPYLMNDTLLQIQNASANNTLKRPLKVKFIGEEGVDEGGVQKEFFQLLMRDMFDPSYGMFKLDEDTRMYWFRASQIDLSMEFELVGIMIGLAIYNSHLLEFSFPMLTYRKLMGHKSTMEDLKEVHPAVYQNLQKLLLQDDVSHLGLVFQAEQEGDFGEGMQTVDLLPEGATCPVTDDNKQLYVDLYMQHLLDNSIAPQFDAFQRGFKKLCGGPALKLFRPEELEKLICGSQNLDFNALQAHTRYDDGYTCKSQVVQWFWQVVHSLQPEQQKQLLSFVTGSDRVPIKGLSSLTPPLTISRAGPHTDRLPTAHTCFNHMLLPEYNDLETLKGRLLLAIQNAEGFGLM